MAVFKVPQPSQQEILKHTSYKIQTGIVSTVRAGARAALYGIGIGAAVVKSKIPRTIEENDNVPNIINTPGYEPDAVPNGRGGYEKTDRWDGYMSSSLDGMPVMSYLKFVGGTYTDLKGNQVTIPDIIFETVLISITYGKRIIRSEVAGRDEGDIIEYIGGGNHTVEISAIITADAPVNDTVKKRIQNGVYPRDNMLEIYRLLDCPLAIPVESWYLQQAGINYLVIDDGCRIDQLEGEYSMQRLSMFCISDNPLVITVAD